MKRQLLKILGIFGALLAIWILAGWIINITFWLISFGTSLALLFLGIFCMRTAGLIKPTETAFEALKRVIQQFRKS